MSADKEQGTIIGGSQVRIVDTGTKRDEARTGITGAEPSRGSSAGSADDASSSGIASGKTGGNPRGYLERIADQASTAPDDDKAAPPDPEDLSETAPPADAGAGKLVISSTKRDPKIVIIAGEHSGDILGGKLIAALNAKHRGHIRYFGVGGPEMAAAGLQSQFPMADVEVMGLGPILKRLPKIVRRVYQTVDSALATEPDAVVIIDSPEFTHPIAKRIRRRAPHISIINYVSPSVWAWRPGRARKMSRYVDHILGLLPFEPEAHERLRGPTCSYVGHPLLERMDWIKSLDTDALAERLKLRGERPVLAVLPGSRSSEISRLMLPFGDTLRKLQDMGIDPQVIVPVVEARRKMVEDGLVTWPLEPYLVEGEEDKFRAFRLADAALAASGTVSLELAVAGAPMVVGYKVGEGTYQVVRHLIRAKSAILANLVLDEIAFPEFLQRQCTPDNLAPAVAALLSDTPERRAQLDALARIPEALAVPGDDPSSAAAEIVLRYARDGRPG